MNLFKSIFNKKKEEAILVETERDIVYAPAEGEIIALEKIEDAMFSQGMLGKGCGINPSKGQIVAPFDGEVVVISATNHALGLKSVHGIELLIHVGMDTVKMNGLGFESLIKAGDTFKCGQILMKFSLSEIKKAGYPDTIAIVVTNSEAYERIELLKQGPNKTLESMLRVL